MNMKNSSSVKRSISLILLILVGAALTGVVLPWEKDATAAGEKVKSAPTSMFDLYEQNREEGVPNYITEDFILLAHSLVINQAITELEMQKIKPMLRELVEALVLRLMGQEKPTDVTRANLEFLSVVKILLSGQQNNVSQGARAELELILKGAGISMSPLMHQRIDYSQFIVRGKYTASKELGNYFRAMKYAGTILFPVQHSDATRISEEAADRLTAQALELSRVITKNQDLSKRYRELDQTLTLLFGPSEELTPHDYVNTWASLPADNSKKIPYLRTALLALARKENRQPRIISLAVDEGRLEPGLKPKDVATGWRLIPQRFTSDSAAFQALVHDRVKDYNGPKLNKKNTPFTLTTINGRRVKGFPMGLELMALLGSQEAAEALESANETSYKSYEKAAQEAGDFLLGSSGNSLASSNMKVMNNWLTRGKEFQKDPLRRINSCLGLWTYQRYITILYTKQSYTIVAKSLRVDKQRKKAWLAPAPDLYHGLRAQLDQLNKVLDSKRLRGMMTILDRCEKISAAELAGTAPDENDAAFLNNLDKELKALTGGEDKPIVVDVHTDPGSGLVLEEALGYPRVVEHKMPDENQARGALFSYYEFKWPLGDRLTDQKWQTMLKDSKKMKNLTLSPGSLLMGKKK